MSGIVMRIVPKTLFVLPAVANTSAQLIWARGIDASRYQNGVLVLRLHSTASFVVNQTITVSYFADGYTADDPGVTNWSQPGAQVITPNGLAMTGGTDGALTVRFSALTSPFPPLIGIGATLTSTVATALKVELSCDLRLSGE